MDASLFLVCPSCGKYVVPPGLTIVMSSANASELFCSTRGDCTRVTCPGCGYFVNPLYHSQWECNQFVKRWGDARVPRRPMVEREVLAEAEAILKDARRK